MLIVFCVAGLLATAMTGCTRKISDRSIENADLATVARWIEDDGDLLVVDARSTSAYLESKISGAINVQTRDLDDPRVMERLRKSGRIVVYGENPASARASALVKRLLASDVDGVFLMEEGIDLWQERGLPVDRR